MFSKSVEHDGILRGASSGPPIFAIIVTKMDFRDINTSISVAPFLNMHKPTRKSSSTNKVITFQPKNIIFL